MEEAPNFKKICRICMKEGTMMPIFTINMHRKIMAIASIKVFPYDGLPKQICTKCASKLHMAYQLKLQCERSDVRLREYITLNPEGNNMKIMDDILPTITSNIATEANLTSEIQTDADNLFSQLKHDALKNLRSDCTIYDNFMKVSQNNPPMAQIILEDIPIQREIQNESFKRNENLEHELTKNEDKEAIACSTCGKFFFSKISLNSHMKIHTKTRKILLHKCHICEKEFSHLGTYKNHLKAHNKDKLFKCPICNKEYKQEHTLKNHMKLHTGERPHQCHFCPAAFITRCSLERHIRTHTGERPFVCIVCQKAFTQSNILKKHMRKHTGEKSHTCDICNKSFNGSGDFLKHSRKHSGEKPFGCPQCNRRFGDYSNLSWHIKSHNLLYPWQCDKCDQNFRGLAKLKAHIRQDHPIGKLINCNCCGDNFDRVDDYFVHIKQKKQKTN